MHQFICKAVEGKIVPLQPSKIDLLNKILNRYESLDKKFKITIESIEKNVNQSQISLYTAFIVKAANHFGNSYNEMENILKRFHPMNSPQGRDSNEIDYYKPINKWTSKELTQFIDEASALLAEQGFIFK